ncbi:MAG TPA: zinc-dependent metalloprotease [Actinomycetota bacterium]
MSDAPGSGFPFGGFDPEALRDAPLFRELQRVMAASSGPVNWELARQVGVATAAEAGDDPVASDEDRRAFEEAARVAELQVARFTGLETPGELTRVRAVRRAEWVTASVDGLRGTIEPAAARIAEATARAMREQAPPEAAGIGGLLSQVAPLLHGTQTGTVLGTLARQVHGGYDVALPRSDTATLLFVVQNVAAFERDWSLDPTEFRTAVAVHEVVHRLGFARPWAAPRLATLLDDFLSTVTIDVGSLQERFSSLDPSDPDALERALGGEEGSVFGAVLDDEQRLKLARIQAFMAAAEGYADHVVHGIGRELLGSWPRIEEAMRRYREGEAGDPVFERLLGIEMRRERYAEGRAFCDAVADRTDEATLARMWHDPEALPSQPELAEPTLWLSRTV